MYYTVVNIGNASYQYNVTLKLFQRCASGRVFPNPTIVSIFDLSSFMRVKDLNVSITATETISITDPDPCITNPPEVCYEVAYYDFVIILPASQHGYVLASQVNFRINGINNLAPGSGSVGATYTAIIPGYGPTFTGPENNSAKFTGSDLVVVCANNAFEYSFGATDPNGDQLRYYFCSAYASIPTGGGAPQPTNPPPFPEVTYSPPFDGSGPLGLNVGIDPNTGLITGVAPDVGIYVVTVCVDEIRDGIVIASQRKDIQIHVADCDVAAASLLPVYMLCKNTQTITLANQSNSPLIVTQEWQFTEINGNVLHVSNDPVVTYTFPTIGVYNVKLVVNRNGQCSDSTTSEIRVYPGFVPDFSTSGICINKPTQFTDLSVSALGTVNSWSWDFGEISSAFDVSSLQHPVYTYPNLGVKKIRFIVTDSRGCRDTVFKSISIVTKPPITLAFRDTLICRNDQLQLQASGSGVFSWSPPVNIINPNTGTPTVSPTTTTTYYVDIDDQGCTNRDSVKVRVVDFVSLQAMPDTTICAGDTIRLRVISDGLQYAWSPATQVLDQQVQNPRVVTPATTLYQVVATIGGCSAVESLQVNTVPYPLARAGADQQICYNTSTVLEGSTDGQTWLWQPAQYLSNPAVLNPIAFPPRTTSFIFLAYDTKGCPKPGRDTIEVIVHPKMSVSAGNDTAVVINQPLQLQATGAVSYVWSPPLYLSNLNIANPIALFDLEADDIRYKVVGTSEAGCRDSAFVNIKLYKTLPTIFVPTAFTPNQDGRNDLLRPIAVGIGNIDYFSVYNRWGQLVFTTNINGKGWDGKLNGTLQASGVYVWMAKATDYTGKSWFNKGTVALIR